MAEGPCPSGDRKWDLELFFAEAAYWPVAHAQNIMLRDLKRMAEDQGYHGVLEFLGELGNEAKPCEKREMVALEVTPTAMETLASEVDTLCLWRDDTLDSPSRISYPNICKDISELLDKARPPKKAYPTRGAALCDAMNISPTFVLACIAKDLRELCNLPMLDLLEFVATGCARREVSYFFMASDSPTPSHPARLHDEGKDHWLLPSLTADAMSRTVSRCDALAVRLLAMTANTPQAGEEDGTKLSGACLSNWERSLGYALVQHALRIAGISEKGAPKAQKDGVGKPPSDQELPSETRYLTSFLSDVAPGIRELTKQFRSHLLELYRKTPGPEPFNKEQKMFEDFEEMGAISPTQKEKMDHAKEALDDLSTICNDWPDDAPQAIEALLSDDDSLGHLLNEWASKTAAKWNTVHESRVSMTSSRPATSIREVDYAVNLPWQEKLEPEAMSWPFFMVQLIEDRYPEILPWWQVWWRLCGKKMFQESQDQQDAQDDAMPEEVSELAVRYVDLLYRLCAVVEMGVFTRVFAKTHRGGSGCDSWDEIVKQKKSYARFVGILADYKWRFGVELGDEARRDPRLQIEFRDKSLSMSEYAKRFGKRVKWVGEAWSIYDEAKRLTSTLGSAATSGTNKAAALLSSCGKVLALLPSLLLDLNDQMESLYYLYLGYCFEGGQSVNDPSAHEG